MFGQTSKESRPLLVSFSGIDGAGKSTQIELLRAHLCAAGFTVRQVAFWDDVAQLTHFRQFTSHACFGSEQGVGTPEKPVNRRDKNVQSWYMTAVRLLLYFVDSISLSVAVAKMRRGGADVVIFDRYVYDELANLPLRHPMIRAYVSGLLKLTPSPDIALVLDANPGQARERKPEYPIDFLEKSRAAYLALSELAREITMIAPGEVSEVAERVLQAASVKVSLREPQSAKPALDEILALRENSENAEAAE